MVSVTADRFLRLACLDYQEWRPDHLAEAEQLFDVARTNIWTAAAAGEVDAIREMLDREPELVNAKGGPHGWEPLLYACYSRLDAPTLDAARVLLERGADPNAGFLWDFTIPFTALTGAYGDGEKGARNQPPHRDRDALARLLLEKGADPNDAQVLYNRNFGRADDHLKLLLEFGLNDPALLAEELWGAARKNYVERVHLLVEHGVDVNVPGRRDGRTPYEAAIYFGNVEIAEYLVAHGAKRVELALPDRFAAACIAGNRAEVDAILGEHPELPETLGAHGRVALVHRAVEARSHEGLRLLAKLGFEISGTTEHDCVGVNLGATPLHNATHDLAMVKLLIELGADPTVRDRTYNATPLEWAEYGGQRDVAEYLRGVAGDGGTLE
jgi:ankyrin repeat protein